tara:strand:+ start:70 stop:561 length:492 start_codon:yes stop_codon:yes gene_type:complete
LSNFCPEWVFGSCCAESTRHFILYNTPLNAVAKKFSTGLSEHYNEITSVEISVVSEEMIRFLDEINAGEEAISYITSYIYRRIVYTQKGVERKFTGLLSGNPLSGEKKKDYDLKKTLRVFKATVFDLRSTDEYKPPAAWSPAQVLELDWLNNLFLKEVDVFDI